MMYMITKRGCLGSTVTQEVFYSTYGIRSVLFVTHWRSPTVRRLLLDICRHVS